MPGCSALLDDIDPGTVIDKPESIKLWLPSALPPTFRDVWCESGLPVLEFRLRYAQAADALSQLRRLRRLVRGLMLQTKKHPVPSQRTMTRSQSVWDGLEARIAQTADCYRDARIALLRLHPSGGWVKFFKELKSEDVRGPGREETDLSESRFIPSWIWGSRAPPTPPDLPGSSSLTSTPPDLAQTSPLIDTDDNTTGISAEEMEDYMLADWARAQERAKRFEEEVELCTEEMRRTLLFFSWSTLQWEKRADDRAMSEKPPSDNVLQGLRAYAHRRSAMFRDLIKAFVNDWYYCLEPKGLGSEWLASYSAFVMPKKGRNNLPSIIPSLIAPIIVRDQGNFDDDVLSDQDEVIGQPVEGTTDHDTDPQPHNDFVQIMADG